MLAIGEMRCALFHKGPDELSAKFRIAHSANCRRRLSASNFRSENAAEFVYIGSRKHTNTVTCLADDGSHSGCVSNESWLYRCRPVGET